MTIQKKTRMRSYTPDNLQSELLEIRNIINECIEAIPRDEEQFLLSIGTLTSDVNKRLNTLHRRLKNVKGREKTRKQLTERISRYERKLQENKAKLEQLTSNAPQPSSI